MIKCDCCGKKDATRKDYRYIDGLFQGKCFFCDDCYVLSDVEIYKIMTGYYKKVSKK